MPSQTIYATTMTGLQSRPIITDDGFQQQTFNNTAGPKRYQLSIHAEDLSNKGGWLRVSSPYAKVAIPSGPKKGHVGETEHVLHSLSPDWAKLFIIEFDKTMHVPIEVTVLDWRGDDREPIVMGKASFEATTVFESPGRMQSEVIMGKKGK
jgi:hypothetical protein